MEQQPAASDNKGPMLMATLWTLHAITLIAFSVRLWSRLRPKFALTAADYTITIAVLSKTASMGLVTACVHLGFGQHAVHVDRSARATVNTYLFIIYILSMIATSFARISIGCLLLQVTLDRRWRILIYGSIFIQAANMLIYIAFQFAQCQSSLSSMIDLKNTNCLTPAQVVWFSHANNAVAFASDLICAIIPGILIKSLTRSTVEKVLTFALLAACLVASGVVIAKMYYTIVFDFASSDGFYIMVDKMFWSRIEESVIIIAACAPLLRGPVERGLKRLGFRGIRPPTPALNSVGEQVTGSSKGSSV
ncbi:hypothetical protein N656DRAFT_771555 [Canariomyces notabilis]|uniref:Rhodopsin domain-containing protein n=1 Tax=Canariomyces notabilis TaxID=2074819 RepID=A0AAN6QL40_9PEZI|nr:hypothetical protein N656DRAFT_771555 [Canariomyces arenarius]